VLSKVSGKGTLSLGIAATAAGKVRARVARKPLPTMLPKVDMVFA